jgi:hypothetical protein
VAQAVSQPLTAVGRVRSQASPCEIGGGQSDTLTDLSPNTSFSSVSTVLPMLDTRLHLHIASYRKDKRASTQNICVRFNVCGFTLQAGRQNISGRMALGVPCNKSSTISIW